jgi:HEAT repeat protein
MRDSDAAVRRNAIRALGNLGSAAPIDALTAKLKGSNEEKADVIRALGAVGKPAADALRGYLRTTQDPDPLQVTGLLALAPNANRDDIAWIAPRLKSKNKYVRAAAASALGHIGHPSAQAALVTALKDRDPLARAIVARALGQIGTIYAARQLVPLLKDPSPLVASMAAWGLGASKYTDAVDALKQVAKSRASRKAAPSRVDDMYGRPEVAAIVALGRIGGADAVATLRESLKSRSWLTRAMAAEALGHAGDKSPEVMADLDKRLADRTNLVRAKALLSLKALGRTFGPGAFQTK